MVSKRLVAYFSASGTTAAAAKTLADQNASVEDCDTIFLGFPIWWYTAHAIINTFLESYNFTGKTIILFATSGGSGLGRTASDVKVSAPGAVIRDGKLLNGRGFPFLLAGQPGAVNLPQIKRR